MALGALDGAGQVTGQFSWVLDNQVGTPFGDRAAIAQIAVCLCLK
jgi:hypothetical protein